MTEKIKTINNPLTIIAIFAALAEVNATIAINLLDKSLHHIFIWFIIGFPSLLFLLFFFTLNYNTRVMYAPSDYREDKTFLDSLYGISKKTIDGLSTSQKITETLEEFEKKLIISIDEKIRNTTNSIKSDEMKILLESYKSEVKELSEKTIKEYTGVNFEIPQVLKTEIVKWIAYPAFLTIIYAIVKEKATSIDKLRSVESKYNFTGRWEFAGIQGLNKIITLTGEKFHIDENVKKPLEKWIKINEKVLKSIVFLYSSNHKQAAMEEARVMAQDLVF